MTPYADPIIGKYLALIKENVPLIKAYYQGAPTRTAASDYPALVISKLGTRAEPITNSEDRHRVALRFTVIVDIRNDLSTEENDAKIVEGVSTLYELVEGRNPADLTLKADSLLGVLRHHLLVDSANELRTDLDTATEVDYGEAQDGRDPSKWRIEARVDIVAHYMQAR